MEISEATNPYVGPAAFRPEQGSLFFGRDREAKKLLALVSSEKAALFYAPSGAGKTSLINARLIPDLRDKGVEVLPVARVGGEFSSQLRPQNVYVFNMLSYLTRVHEDPAGLEPLQEMSLCELFPHDGTRHRRVLILDQFEEILTAHPEHRDEREGFFQQVREALEAIPLLSVLFAMREDHIAALDRYAPLLPERLQGRFRMERLRYEAALMAVRRPAEKVGRPFADGVAERLVDDLRQENIAGADRKIAGEFVEPVQLQVVCYQLWENLRECPGREITAADLEAFGDVDQALEGFFEKAVGRVARTSGVAERRIVHWFGEILITPARIRNQVHKDAETTGGLPNHAVDLLEAEHLIRAERARGALWYELVHDRFIEPILAAKKRRRKARAAIRFRLMAAALIVALIAGLMLFLAYEKQERAAESRRLAEQAQEALVQEEDPQKSLRLALAAAQCTYSADSIVLPKAEDALRQALHATRARTIWSGSIDEVSIVGLSPDGKHLATGHNDGTVKVWDAESGTLLANLSGHRDRITQIVVGPAGTALATAAADNTARIWNTRSFQQAYSLSGVFDGLAISSDGKRLATVSADQVEVWDALSGSEVDTIIAPDFVYAVAFSPDGESLVTGNADNTVTLWNFGEKTAEKTLTGHEGGVYIAVFSPDGRSVATAGLDLTVKVWDLDSSDPPQTLVGACEATRKIALSQDANQLVTVGRGGATCIWNLDSSREVLVIGEDPEGRLAASGVEGRRLATVAQDGTAKMWELVYEVVPTLSEGREAVRAVAFSPDGKRLATAGDDRTAEVWDLMSREVVLTLRGHEKRINAVVFSPDGKFLATAGHDGTTKIWDAEDGELRNSLSGDDRYFTTVAFSSDGKLLATAGSTGVAKLWDSDSGTEVRPFRGHNGRVMAVAFDPDDERLATAGFDKTAKVWNVASGELLLTLAGHEDPLAAVSWSPDGRYLATGSFDDTARLWRLDSGEVILPLAAHQGTVNAVEFSPDSSRLATGGADGAVFIWDCTSARLLFELPGSLVRGVSFSPDGKLLAVAGNDGTVRLETISIDDLITTAEERKNWAMPLESGSHE